MGYLTMSWGNLSDVFSENERQDTNRTDAPAYERYVWFELSELQTMLLLLFSFRDLWKEWGDSSFQIFTELPVPPQAAGVVGTF